MIMAAYTLYKWLILNKSLLNYYLDVSILDLICAAFAYWEERPIIFRIDIISLGTSRKM
jgi:hypothetical protein